MRWAAVTLSSGAVSTSRRVMVWNRDRVADDERLHGEVYILDALSTTTRPSRPKVTARAKAGSSSPAGARASAPIPRLPEESMGFDMHREPQPAGPGRLSCARGAPATLA